MQEWVHDMRSWLFIPGDSEKKLAKAVSVSADAYIIDLEDSVQPENKARARELCRSFLTSDQRLADRQYWVRVNPINHGECEDDLETVLASRPDGIVLPKAEHPDEVRQLGRRLDILEMNRDLKQQSIRILPLVTETPLALFSLGGYADNMERLAGLTWGAEDLAAAIGASTNRDEFGHWTTPFQLARNLCLFAAHAAGVHAIDTIFADFKDLSGLEESCHFARRDGFTGKLAIHPDQVDVINHAFTPSIEEIEHARRIVELFEENPGAGALSMDGTMVDLPHLQQAKKLLKRVNRLEASEA
jgi:citrate lyase subunit beta/citryl-CoA lyase